MLILSITITSSSPAIVMHYSVMEILLYYNPISMVWKKVDNGNGTIINNWPKNVFISMEKRRVHTWWPDGKPKMDYTAVNDEYEGLFRQWNAAGLLVRQFNYKNSYLKMAASASGGMMALYGLTM